VSTKLSVHPHLSDTELAQRAASAKESGEWRRWMAVVRFSRGESAGDIAKALERKPDWVRRTVRDYNAGGPDSVRDGRFRSGRGHKTSPELRQALFEAVQHDEPSAGGRWLGIKAQQWFADQGVELGLSTTYRAMHLAGLSVQLPRPRHAKADAEAQEAFKKKGLPTPSKP
jgi:transposase